jgi:DNA-binding MarR family transcriptional regulator
MTDELHRIDHKILSALERLHTATRTAFAAQGYVQGLSPLQAQILHHLHRNPAQAVSVTLLAEIFRVTKPTVSDSIATLESKKLIKKTASKVDARGYTVKLTKVGLNVAINIREYAAPFLASLERLDPNQKEALWDALIHLLGILKDNNLIPLTRMCFSCRHFGEQVNGARYYCHLLNAPLPVADLRVDCAEHVLKEAP